MNLQITRSKNERKLKEIDDLAYNCSHNYFIKLTYLINKFYLFEKVNNLDL